MFKSYLTILALLFTLPTFAAEGSNESRASSFSDQLYLNYFATFNGPGVTDMSNTTALNNNGLVKRNDKVAFGHINFDSEITAAYLITPTIGVGPVVPFIFFPTQGYGAILGDVGVKAFNKKFITAPNLNIYANLILQLPTSDNSQANGMDLGVKTTPNVRYILPNSRFAVGAWTEAKAYLGVNQGTAKTPMKSFKLFGLPYVNYQASPNFSWNMGFEMEASHFNHLSAMDFTMVKTDLQPGFVYMITPKVMVNPFLQVFTSEKVALDRTALSAVLSASL